MAGRFGSVITAMATPFRDDFSLDLDRAQEMASWLLDHGSDGLVVFGSTGEAATQSDAEKRDLLRAVKEAAAGRGSIIAGTGTYDTAHSIHLTHMAEENGADLIVVGNKGMTGARRYLLGSVPNNVSHHAPCSVIIVRTT